MGNLQFRSAITIFTWLTILSFIIFFSLISDISFKELAFERYSQILKPIGLIVTMDIIIWNIFNKWGWKLRIFNGWLVKTPDLNGVWIGNYKNKSKIGKAKLEITQTLTMISCRVETENGISTDYSTNILYDPEKNYKKLVITYNYELQSNEQNKDHRGTYDLFIDEKNRIMKGSYWTNKPSKGRIISLEKINI